MADRRITEYRIAWQTGGTEAGSRRLVQRFRQGRNYLVTCRNNEEFPTLTDAREYALIMRNVLGKQQMAIFKQETSFVTFVPEYK